MFSFVLMFSVQSLMSQSWFAASNMLANEWTDMDTKTRKDSKGSLLKSIADIEINLF